MTGRRKILRKRSPRRSAECDLRIDAGRSVNLCLSDLGCRGQNVPTPELAWHDELDGSTVVNPKAWHQIGHLRLLQHQSSSTSDNCQKTLTSSITASASSTSQQISSRMSLMNRPSVNESLPWALPISHPVNHNPIPRPAPINSATCSINTMSPGRSAR